MAEQLSLPLPTRSALGRDDFFVSKSNSAAVSLLDDIENWPDRRLVLVGSAGSGKTHLAHVFASDTGANVLSGRSLQAKHVDELANAPLVLDDADQAVEEQALFHLYNLLAARGHNLLLTATTPPGRWPIALPDLISRLSTISIATLEQPDDALLSALLAKHFDDRGIKPPITLIPYLLPRLERSFEFAARLVAELDRVALATHRPIGTRLAGEVLDKMAASDA